MSPTSETRQTRPDHCPVCGGALAADAPRGLCSKCLLEGVADPADDPATTTGMRPQAPELERVAAAFPQLEVLRLLGIGGMGAVYLARQKHLDRLVALKILPESLAARPAFAERFNREARVLARLNHPNIVTVHDFGQSGGFCFLLMEYVDGVNLRQAMRAGRFTPSQALDLVPRICEALQFAHDEGVLHRDIKPENLLLDTRGRIKIADFGIAKLVGDAAAEITLTASGATLGTPAYMAPEQIENPASVDHRADIYSLGVVLYELLTGELPLGRFAPPSAKTPVDTRVDDVVFRALEKERSKRFQTATAVRTSVETLQQQGLGPAPAPAPEAPAPPPGASAPSGRAVPDFLLCHPALPRMAQALCVYGLLAFPLMMLLGLPTLETPRHSNPYAAFVGHLTFVVGLVGDLLTAPLLVIGAWKLRRLRASAPAWLRRTLSLHLFFLALALGGSVWEEALQSGPDLTPAPSPLEALTGAFAVVAVIFEIAALVWLYRYRIPLEEALERGRVAEASAPSGRPAEVYLSAPPPTARRATAGAVLTLASLGLGLPALASLGMAVAAWAQPQGPGGLGPLEVFLVLVLAGGIGGLALGGFAAGLRALAELRASAVPLAGLRRALFAVWAWPLVLATLAAEIGSGLAFFRICDTAFMAILFTAVFSLGCAELVLRFAWSRGFRTTAGPRPPAWTHGLATLAVVACTIALFPGWSVVMSNALRAHLPPMEVRVEGDPALPEGVITNRPAMQLGISAPPRSIVHVQTAILRDHQVLRSPLSEFHLVNPALLPADLSLLVRVPTPAPPSNDPSLSGSTNVVEWELVGRTREHTHAYHYRGGEDARSVRWSPVGRPPVNSFPVGDSLDVEILRGEEPDGTEWSVRLVLQADPLVPAIEVADQPLLAPGRDWSATVRRAGLDPDHR